MPSRTQSTTGLGGAQAFGYGLPRGFVLGMRVLLADGRHIKAGGTVVKNVAGYDLCKLYTGSMGTLGVLAELTFKVKAAKEAKPNRYTSLACVTKIPLDGDFVTQMVSGGELRIDTPLAARK